MIVLRTLCRLWAAIFVCVLAAPPKRCHCLQCLIVGDLALESHRLLGIINVQKMHIVLFIQLALGKDVLDML